MPKVRNKITFKRVFFYLYMNTISDLWNSHWFSFFLLLYNLLQNADNQLYWLFIVLSLSIDERNQNLGKKMLPPYKLALTPLFCRAYPPFRSFRFQECDQPRRGWITVAIIEWPKLEPRSGSIFFFAVICFDIWINKSWELCGKIWNVSCIVHISPTYPATH